MNKSIYDLMYVPWPYCFYQCSIAHNTDDLECCENFYCIPKLVTAGLESVCFLDKKKDNPKQKE
jgi:hypothetical protein